MAVNIRMYKTQNTTPWVSGANPTKFNKTSKIETDRSLKKPFPKFPEQQLSKNTSVQLDGQWLNVVKSLEYFNPSKTAVMTISNQRNMHPPLFFNNIHLSETNTHKHLGLIFHHSLSWHTHILHLHQKAMTKINRLRSFSNSLPRHSLLTIYKTNILPIFDCGSIIYDNCSDSDKHLLDKAQLSAAKIILGCL